MFDSLHELCTVLHRDIMSVRITWVCGMRVDILTILLAHSCINVMTIMPERTSLAWATALSFIIVGCLGLGLVDTKLLDLLVVMRIRVLISSVHDVLLLGTMWFKQRKRIYNTVNVLSFKKLNWQIFMMNNLSTVV